MKLEIKSKLGIWIDVNPKGEESEDLDKQWITAESVKESWNDILDEILDANCDPEVHERVLKLVKKYRSQITKANMDGPER